MQRKYGWKPDLPDHRDVTMKLERLPETLPESVDLRPTCPPVYDQGQLGSCTANAICGAMEFDLRKEGHDVMLSRLFVYYTERSMENSVNYDAGANIRDGVRGVILLGTPPETVWPYSDANPGPFMTKPSQQAYAEAVQYKVSSYERILRSPLHMKACLASGSPFVFGFSAYESFESEAVAQSGLLNMPAPQEVMVGGHAVVCVGYDDKTNRFLIRNSFGNTWGMQGYFTMPYDYLLNPDLSDDFWIIKAVKF